MQVLAAFRGAFQEAGGRTIEVTNREYQLRGSVNTDDLDKLDYLVLGRDRAGQAVQLRDVGYLQVGYDLRRGIADLDGNGEVVGGIAIMEQGRNVLAVTEALKQRLSAAATLAAGRHRDCHDLRPLVADLGNAHEFLSGDRLRAAGGHPRHCRCAQEPAGGSGAGVHPVARHAVHGPAPFQASTRPSTCLRSPVWPSPSAKWPMRRS